MEVRREARAEWVEKGVEKSAGDPEPQTHRCKTASVKSKPMIWLMDDVVHYMNMRSEPKRGVQVVLGKSKRRDRSLGIALSRQERRRRGMDFRRKEARS